MGSSSTVVSAALFNCGLALNLSRKPEAKVYTYSFAQWWGATARRLPKRMVFEKNSEGRPDPDPYHPAKHGVCMLETFFDILHSSTPTSGNSELMDSSGPLRRARQTERDLHRCSIGNREVYRVVACLCLTVTRFARRPLKTLCHLTF